MSNIEADISNSSPGITDVQYRTAESMETPVFECSKKIAGGRRKSPLSIVLAGLLLAFFPATDAAAQACTQTTVISTASSEPVSSSADGECIRVPSSGDVTNRISATHDNVKISIDAKIEHDSYTFNTIQVSGNNPEVKVGRSGSVVANKSKNAIETTVQGARVIIEGKVISTAPSGLGSGTAIDLTKSGYLEIRESGLVSSGGQGGPGLILREGGTVVVAGTVEQKKCTAGPGLCPNSRLAINSGTGSGDATIILLPRSRLSGELRLQEGTSSKDNIIRIGPGYYSGSNRISRTGWVRIDGDVRFSTLGGGGKRELHLNSNQGVRISGRLEGAKLVRIEKGDLIFAGHIDLGTSGIVDVYQAGRLTFEIGENAAGDANTYGRLTAGTLNLVDTRTGSDASFGGRVYTGFKEGLTAAQISAIKDRLPKGRNPTNPPTILTVGQIAFVPESSDGVRKVPHHFKVTEGGATKLAQDVLYIHSGNSASIVAMLNLEIGDGDNIIGKANFFMSRFGLIKTLRTSTVTGSTLTRGIGAGIGAGGGGGGTGGGGGGGGALGVGLLALLIGNFADQEDPDQAQFGSYFIGSGQAAGRPGQAVQIRFQPDNNSAWVQAAGSRYASYGTSYLNARGSRFGWELYRSGGYFLNAALAPRTTAAPGGHRGSAQGHLLSLSAGWKDSSKYLGLGLTRGWFDTDSMLYDGTTKAFLRGDSSFDHTRASLTARGQVETGEFKTTASASLFGGEISQSAYSAGNSVMTAEIPAWRQRYSGSSLGLSLSTRKQFTLLDSVSVSPHLKVSASRVSAGASDAIRIRQSDRAGVLSFEKSTVLQGVPESLNMLSFGADIKPMDKRRGVFRVGYAGMEADGDYEHAAVAAYRLRF